MSNENAQWFLTELSLADQNQLEDGGVEIYGEDEQGNEGSCFMSVEDIAKMGIARIEELEAQLSEAQSHTVDTFGKYLMREQLYNFKGGFTQVNAICQCVKEELNDAR